MISNIVVGLKNTRGEKGQGNVFAGTFSVVNLK